MTPPTDEDRARELLDLFNADDLRFDGARVAELIAKAFAAVRSETVEACAVAAADVAKRCWKQGDIRASDGCTEAVVEIRALAPPPAADKETGK